MPGAELWMLALFLVTSLAGALALSTGDEPAPSEERRWCMPLRCTPLPLCLQNHLTSWEMLLEPFSPRSGAATPLASASSRAEAL